MLLGLADFLEILFNDIYRITFHRLLLAIEVFDQGFAHDRKLLTIRVLLRLRVVLEPFQQSAKLMVVFLD